jgi:hypothetical protein
MHSKSPKVFEGVVFGVSLAGSIATMMGTFYTPPEKGVQKHLFWLVSLVHLSPAFVNMPSVIGVQCMPGCYTESFVLLQPCHPLSSCTLHNRRGWIHFICWSNCYVRGYHLPLHPIFDNRF